VLVLPVSATLALFSKEVLNLWLADTDASQHAYKILTLLIVGTALNALMTLPYTLQLAHGWTRLALYKNIIAVILLVPLMVLMVQRYGGIGAAWVWIILNLGYLLSEVPIMHRHVLKGEMGHWYKEDIFRPLVIVAAVGLLARIMVPVDASTFVILFGILIATGLSFTISTLASNHLNVRSLTIPS
jgi:O-antigen/teichoic acid export membrane protein